MNLFANVWRNHIPDVEDPLLKPLEARFATATDYIQTVGLSEMASFDQYGNPVDEVIMPFEITFDPSGNGLNFASTVEEGYTDFRDDLETIPVGTQLF